MISPGIQSHHSLLSLKIPTGPSMAGNLARYIAGTCTQPHAGPPTTPLSPHLAYIFFDAWRLERAAHTRRRHRDLPLAQLVDELWSITLPASCMWARRLKASQ